MMKISKSTFLQSFLSLLLLLPAAAFSQGTHPAITEKQFVESPLFFHSWYLNPYEADGFRKVTAGLLDDPFLKVYLNPADMPEFSLKNHRIYLDIRGWRYNLSGQPVTAEAGGTVGPVKKPSATVSLPLPGQADYLASHTPYISLGYLARPFRGKFSGWSLGFTYQLVRSEDAVPGTKISGLMMNTGDDPVIMNKNLGHFAGAFLACRLTSRLQAGLSLSGAYYRQERTDDQYYRSSTEAGAMALQDYRLDYGQDYRHLDAAAGLRYRLLPAWTAGVKLGYLQGRVRQTNLLDYDRIMKSISTIPAGWTRTDGTQHDRREWERPGKFLYALFRTGYAFATNSTIGGFFSTGLRRMDVNNRTAAGTRTFSTEEKDAFGTLRSSEGRQQELLNAAGSGTREEWFRQGMLHFSQQMASFATIKAGLSYRGESVRLNSTEAVSSSIEGNTVTVAGDTTREYFSRIENKSDRWDFESDATELMIPFYLEMRLQKFWQVYLGVNHILRETTIHQTDESRILYREINNNGQVTTEQNIYEITVAPVDKSVTRETVLLAGTEIMLSENLRLNVLLSPRFKDIFHIQFWRMGMILAI